MLQRHEQPGKRARQDRRVKQQPWYPYASAALWGAGVGALTLVNSGSVLLAVVLALVVAAISWRLARRQSGGSADS